MATEKLSPAALPTKAKSPKIPTMPHFGGLDVYIPMSDVETIKSKQPSVHLYTYSADHGFQCDERDTSRNAEIIDFRPLR